MSIIGYRQAIQVELVSKRHQVNSISTLFGHRWIKTLARLPAFEKLMQKYHMDYLHCLSKQDLIGVLEIIHDARLHQTVQSFEHCLQRLNKLILFDSAIAFYSENFKVEETSTPHYLYHNLGFPDELHKRYRDNP